MINAYLNFPGTCAEAFRAYEKIFDGKIAFIMKFGDSPMKDQVPVDQHDRVIHATLAIAGGVVGGSDAPVAMFKQPQGFAVSVSLPVADCERIFPLLADGGTVTMELQKTFWAERFGMVTDRFGTPWMLSGDHNGPP